jgi:hypothetical protein
MSTPGNIPLTQEQTTNVSRVKILENNLLDFLSSLTDVDKRWLAIAKTHIQEGSMAATRSITRPNGN